MLNWLDILIIILYSGGLLGLGYLFKGQKNTEDYFLGGKSFSWFELGLSTMATQLSAISFISAAAFVGMKQNGGLQWLTFELAVPLAMIFLMVVLVPPLYKAGVFSIYEFLERRFDQTTRTLISLVFQVSRAFATGMMINAVALVLSAVLQIPIWQTVVAAGVVTIIYSYQGGMKAVVWGDAIQMIILVVGILVCTGYALSFLGGFEALKAQVDPSRLQIIDFNWGIGAGQEFGFWPMVIGGFFLYASYYGCDQSQAQRSLSGKSLRQVQGALMLNGLVRFPIVLCYCLMGLIVGTFAAQTPEFMQMIPTDDPDQMMPLFIAHYLPHGILGLLIIAILASAMSSLSSAVNSLSAASVEDLVIRFRKSPLTEAQRLNYSKMATVFWGIVCLLLAFVGDQIADTIIEAINKIGSVFFGPILATFMLAILSKRAHARGANIGLLAGVGLNLYIWLGVGDGLFWIWWNFTGALATLSVGLLASYLIPAGTAKTLSGEPREWLRWQNGVLLAYFLFMIGICSWLPAWLQ